MKTKTKVKKQPTVYLQCWYEDECKTKDCLNKCPRKESMILCLSEADKCVIEDFAMCDIEYMLKEKPKELELKQNIMRKLMVKVFNKEKINKLDKKK